MDDTAAAAAWDSHFLVAAAAAFYKREFSRTNREKTSCGQLIYTRYSSCVCVCVH